LLEKRLKSVIHPAGLLASWLLTWFTHDFADNLKDSKTIFQFAMSLKSPLAALYLSAALLLLNAAQLQKSTTDPFDLILAVKKLPRGTAVRKLTSCTGRLMQLFPPERLMLHFPQLRFKERKRVFDVSFVIKLGLLVFCYVILLQYIFTFK
jgi:hypothetical protein